MGHPIQIILARQLAGYLSVPVFLVDQNGNLLFYNEPAELIHGQRCCCPFQLRSHRSLWEQLKLCELISSAAKQKLIAYERALSVLIVKRCLPLS
jgi:hypothetical protein